MSRDINVTLIKNITAWDAILLAIRIYHALMFREMPSGIGGVKSSAA